MELLCDLFLISLKLRQYSKKNACGTLCLYLYHPNSEIPKLSGGSLKIMIIYVSRVHPVLLYGVEARLFIIII